MSSFRESITQVTATIDCLHREIASSVLDFSNGLDLFHPAVSQVLSFQFTDEERKCENSRDKNESHDCNPPTDFLLCVYPCRMCGAYLIVRRSQSIALPHATMDSSEEIVETTSEREVRESFRRLFDELN